jgi:hypothetical protein
MADNGWIGVDLDGTLAEYDFFRGDTHIGPPIPAMLERVKGWLAEGREVRIFTARASEPVDHNDIRRPPVPRPVAIKAVEDWCLKHLGVVLPVTNVKDQRMDQLWDDRVVQVIRNTGEPLTAGA